MITLLLLTHLAYMIDFYSKLWLIKGSYVYVSIIYVCYRQFALFASDVELFTKHARRKRVNAEDVLMLVRRTPSLHNHLSKLRSDGKA